MDSSKQILGRARNARSWASNTRRQWLNWQTVPVAFPALVVVISALLITAPIWGIGDPWGSDSWGHLQQATFIGQTLRQYGLLEGLRQSAWMPDWYLGTPTYVYYPPLSPFILGVLTAVLGDAFRA